MFWIAENVKTFLIDSMHTRKVELSSSGERLEVIHIRRRGIFQGCLFVVHDFINFGIEKINSSLLLRKKVNQLFMKDLKLFENNEDQIDSLM